MACCPKMGRQPCPILDDLVFTVSFRKMRKNPSVQVLDSSGLMPVQVTARSKA